MNAVVTIRDYWEVIVGVVMLIAWFVRLEVKQTILEREFEKKEIRDAEKETSLWAKINSIQDTCTQVLQSVARLEGKLDNKRD